MPVMPTWSSKLGHLEWHVSWAFWATGPDPLLVKSTSCRNVRVGPLLRLKTAPEPGMAIPLLRQLKQEDCTVREPGYKPRADLT